VRSSVSTAIWKARLILLAAFSITLLWASPAKAGTTITQNTCPVIIISPGEYDLATDVACPPLGDGIDILASDVTLHLNGHTISTVGGNCSDGAGIHVMGTPLVPLAGVRILGPGTITNFGNFTGLPNAGFLAEFSAGSFVKFVTVTADCAGVPGGFWIESSSSMWKLDSNVVSESVTGGSGIFVEGNDNDLIRNNVNKMIVLFGSSNTVVNNSAHDDRNGILVNTGSNNNEIDANTTDSNSFRGIWILKGATGNNVTGNNSFNNATFDMEDDNPNCDSNKWRGNHFNTSLSPPTTNPSCIN
jgi:copper-binding protein NosD